MEKILYDYFRSTAAYRVRIGLNIKGIDVKQIPINLKPGIDEQHGVEYRNINPQGRVPYYVVKSDDGNFQLGQSTAILEYLEQKYPTPSLYPEDIQLQASIRQLTSTIACDIHPLNNLSVLDYLKKEFEANADAVNRWYSHWVTEGFKAVEIQLTSQTDVNKNPGPYSFGDTITMADLYLIPQVYNARRFSVNIDDFPRIQGIEAECLQLDTFIRARPELQADAK